MTTEPLQHLTEQSAGVGSWVLKVMNEPVREEYKWTTGGKSGAGAKLTYVLLSEDHTQYCEGLYKKAGEEPKATENFKQAQTKHKKGTIWKVSQVSLAQQNPRDLGCSHKVAIVMNKSTFTPVLQSTVKMPTQVAPPDDLATLLKRPKGQIVDAIALVAHVSEPVLKRTGSGERDLVDVTIMDDSGTNGAASCKFPAWFPRAHTPNAQLNILKEAVANRTPVAFFNLVVHKETVTTGATEHDSKERRLSRRLEIDFIPKAAMLEPGRRDLKTMQP